MNAKAILVARAGLLMERSNETATGEITVPRWVLAALFLTAISYQTFENLRSDAFYLTPDKMHHILSAQAFMNGFGMSHLMADPRNLGELVVAPHTLWSTGYSLLLAGVLPVTHDIYRALAVADFFATAVFFLAWWLITAELKPLTGTAGRLFILGWWALVHSPLGTSTMDASGSSDMLSIGLFSLGIWLSIRIPGGRREFLWALLSGACYGAAAGVRYAYWPLIVAGPMALLAITRRGKVRAAMCAAVQLAVAAVFILIVVVSQPSGAMHTIHDRVEEGFHWGQLSTLFPFPSNAIGIFSALRSARGHFPQSLFVEDGTPVLLWIFSLAIIGIAVWGAARYLRGYFRNPDSDGQSAAPALVLATTAGAMAITVAMLCYLTIRIPADGTWTYGSMPRYYMPAELFLFVGLGSAFHRVWDRVRRQGGIVPRIALAGGLFLLAAGPVGLRAGRIDAMARGVHPASGYTLALKALQREIPEIEKHGFPVVYADTKYERVLLAGMAGARMLQMNGPADIPSLQRANAILVTSVPKDGPEAPSNSLIEKMRKRGATIAPGGESFDLLVLDLSKLPGQ